MRLLRCQLRIMKMSFFRICHDQFDALKKKGKIINPLVVVQMYCFQSWLLKKKVF